MAAIVVLTTAPDAKTAARLARALVMKKLAACVTRLPGARSTYRWKGKLESAREEVMLVKTDSAKLKKLEMFLKRNHPYETPEFLALRVTRGSSEYLRWLAGSLR